MPISAFGDRFWQGIAPGQETTDATAGVGTGYSMTVGQSFYGTISNSTDQDWIAIELVAGQVYDFRLLGMGFNFLSDPLIRLMNSAGVEVASNDDGFTSNSSTHERDSRLVFTATSTGTFYLAADAFSTEIGGYLLTATANDTSGMVFTADEIAWQLLNNGEAFFSAPEAAGFNVGVDNSLTVNITGLTEAGQFLAREALKAWSAVTNITFVETSDAAEITFDDTQTGAFAQPVYSGGAIVSSTVNVGLDWLTSFGTTLNSYSFETYIHEIGHALGLGHGGNYNGSATYNTDNFYLNDGIAWSIMSYMQAENDEFDFGGANDWNTFLDASFRYVMTPMIADIIAIQHLYGVSSEFTGNTTWGFNGNTGLTAIDTAVQQGALMAMTVYDTGGVDTLDFSQTSEAQIISLAAESMSSVLGGRHNLSIARGVQIENVIGGSGVDTIRGNAANNILDGKAGADHMTGGLGNDTYIVDNVGDVIVEVTDQGTDTVRSSISFAFTGQSLENLTLTGSANINATANSKANILIGNSGNNVLDGKTGADHMTGGLGNDTYIVDNVGDVIVEVTGQGTDTVRSSISFAFTGQSLENLTLTGSANINATANSKANILIGNSGNNILDGKTGADHMTGGLGNDTYIVDHVGDVIVEVTDQGTDTVRSSISFAFTGQSLENLTLTGSANINATANSKANILIGNSGNNILDGKTGADHMTGGLGNDTYIVDNVGDVIVEVTDQGTDTVRSSISFAFTGQSLENLTLTGSANINATANSKANILIGNSGNNVLDGKTGADHMTGGDGDDTYIVDNAGDVIVEVTGQGTDTVRSSISFAFSGQSLENLTLTGTANINATANSKANIVIGNTGKNVIDGKGGADVLTGGGGVDTFTFGSTADSTVAASDRITDLSAGDFIDLSRIDANTTVGGVQHFSLVDTFTNTAGQVTLTYNAGTNITSLMADTNGDGTADMLIRINGDHEDHANFIFGG